MVSDTAIDIHCGVCFKGNAGDSGAVLSRDGKAIAMSTSHKPTNIGTKKKHQDRFVNILFIYDSQALIAMLRIYLDESTRILFSGGYVENGRANGLLATSRALGDFGFKSTDTSDPEEQVVIGKQVVTLS